MLNAWKIPEIDPETGKVVHLLTTVFGELVMAKH